MGVEASLMVHRARCATEIQGFQEINFDLFVEVKTVSQDPRVIVLLMVNSTYRGQFYNRNDRL